jgi:hypothetical protein
MRGETGALYVVGPEGKPHSLTDVEAWLKAVEDFPERSPTLFLLDLCHSGVAARLPWQLARADGRGRAWVIAASQPDRQAFDGRFTQAAATVLGRLRRGELDVDRSVRYVPLGTVAREIRREVGALAKAADSYPQQVTCSVIDISAQPEVPFFPNPGYRDDDRSQVRGRIDTALAPFLDDLDEVFDARHFINRAAGHGPMADHIGTGCFSGRKAELTALTAWMNKDEEGPVRLVTGSAGVGKSALIGVLVCAAHPQLRMPTRLLWEQAERVPGRVPHMAASHARQRSLAELTQSLASQLDFGACPGPADLIDKVRRSPTRPLIVLDALDEAIDPAALMVELLLPLIAAMDGSGDPACRLLIGVRDDPPFASLREAAEGAGGLIDLNDVPDRRLRDDLDEYVGKLLRSQAPYEQRAYAAARAMFAASVAETLVASRAGRRWGEFLVAALYTHHLLTAHQPVTDPAEAERLGLAIPSELPDVLELDLRTRHDAPFLRQVLAVLAHALGEGMPATLIRAAAPAFGQRQAQPPSAQEIAVALDAARFYLRRTVDSDGTTIYRLFHQGLADYLRQHPQRALAAALPETALRLLLRLLGTLPQPGGGTVIARQWTFAEPYLLRHALQHAEDAKRQALMTRDPEFLVHADPEIAVPFIAAHAPVLEPRHLEYYYLAAADGLDGLNVHERRQVLSFTAARLGNAELARKWANPPDESPLPWQPAWIARAGHDSVVDAVLVGHPGDRVVAAITRSGVIRILDLATGQVRHTWPDHYNGCVIQDFSIAGHSALLVLRDDELICLDPGGEPEFKDAREVLSREELATLEPAGSDTHTNEPNLGFVAIAAGRLLNPLVENGILRIRDIRTGGIVGDLTGKRGHTDVTAMANVAVDGRPLLATGTADGALGLWDLATRTLHDSLVLDGPIGSIAPAGPDRLVVIVDGDVLALRHGDAITG